MNILVGDKLIWSKTSYRGGPKTYIVEVLKIVPNAIDPLDITKSIVEFATICNAHTGKKRRALHKSYYGGLESLEEFLDAQRAWIKELEKYL